MQSYENKTKVQESGKQILLEFLDFLRYKIENDCLSMEEVDSISRFIQESITLYGTTGDFAKFYGRSKENVKVVVCRKMPVSPKRLVLYPFNVFRKLIPSTWRLHETD